MLHSPDPHRQPRSSRPHWPGFQLTRLVAVLVVALLTIARPAAAQLNAEAAARAIAPFVNDATVLVLRCDITRLNTDAILNEYERLMLVDAPKQPAPEHDAIRARIARSRETARQWRDGFIGAGGTELFAAVRISVDEPEVILVVPTTAASRANALTASIKDGLPAEMTRSTKVVDGAVLGAASAALLADLPLATPTRARELARAFATADAAAPIQGVFVPSDVVRKAFTELMPQLPEQMGGAAMSTITDGAQWGSFSLSIAPAGALSVRLQSISPAAATALVGALRGMADRAAAHETVRTLPGADAVVRMLVPSAREGRVALDISGSEFGKILAVVVPAMTRARQAATEAVTASHIRALVQGCMIYAADNKDEHPPTLEALIDVGYITPELLINRNRPSQRPGFVYRKPDRKDAFSPAVVVVYEAYDAWPTGGIWVGFTDGHVDRVTSEEAFKKMLEQKAGGK